MIVLDCGHVLAHAREVYTCDACLRDADETLRQYAMVRGEEPGGPPVREWRRWGKWRAHLFVDGVQACKIRHQNFERGGLPTTCVTLTRLGPHGFPFGPVCLICERIFERARGAA